MAARHKNISGVHHLVRSGVIGFGSVTHRRGNRLGPRLQTLHQLLLVHRGSVRIEGRDRILELNGGQGVLLSPGQTEHFTFSSRQETRHSWCQVTPAQTPKELAPPPEAAWRVARWSPAVGELMKIGLRRRALEAAQPRPSASTCCLVLSAIWAFINELDGQSWTPHADLSQTPRGRFLDAIEQQLSQPTTLEDLARASGVSRGYLVRLVRQQWDVTPMEMLWRVRCERATQLLRDTGLSLSQIAYRVGFANPFHFSRRFSRRYGVSPRAWRENCWHQQPARV